MNSPPNLIIPLRQASAWFDDGLHTYLQMKGWPAITRSQSMVLISVIRGVSRSSEIARVLGVSRQAAHITINGMVALGLLALTDDPQDGRSKVVTLSDGAEKMREHAFEAASLMGQELSRRLGADAFEALHLALMADWGEPMGFGRTSDAGRKTSLR
jgi:DNA-binding MarR family transcriptional regulator